MTAHGEVVRSYEPEEMEPTKKQRFCALVHGSARLDDHAIIGDVTHERTVQRRGASANARIVDGYIHFWESTKIRLKPGILAVSPCHTPRKGDATWCCSPSRAWARARRGSEGGFFFVNMKFAELCVH